MAENELIQEVLSKSSNRRSMLRKIATATAALSAGATIPGVVEAQTAAPSAADVLQFALNLEYLEAEFYSLGAFGVTIDKLPTPVAITGSGTAGATTTAMSNVIALGTSLGTTAINFSQGVFSTIQAIAADEIDHVILLRSALTAAGATPIAKPAINLDAFYPLGVSIGNQAGFLLHARIFEDIGVSAYAGAAALLSGATLTYAARILATEGEHVGAIRQIIARLGIASSFQSPLGVPFGPIDAADVLPPQSLDANAANNQLFLQNTVGATTNTPAVTNPVNIFSTNSSVTITPNGRSVNGTGLPPTRTPGQVLYAAYGVALAGLFPAGVITTTKGGFFPNGVNGSLNTATAPAPLTNLTT